MQFLIRLPIENIMKMNDALAGHMLALVSMSLKKRSTLEIASEVHGDFYKHDESPGCLLMGKVRNLIVFFSLKTQLR